MKTIKVGLLTLILIMASASMLFVSCDKEEDKPAIQLDDLVGSWKAASSVMTNNSDPDTFVDLIAMGGELRFTMLENGGVRTWFTLQTYADEWDSQAELSGNTLTLTPVEASRGVSTFEIELDNETLVLTNENDSFDFTFSGGTEVAATSVTTFAPN